jgi:hypothetical protein
MRKNFLAVLLITGIIAITSTALADKPSWAGGGDKNGNKHEQNDSYKDNRKDDRQSADNNQHQSNEKNYQHSENGNRDQNNERNYQHSDYSNRNQSNDKYYRQSNDQYRNSHDGKRNAYFREEHRQVINVYYREHYSHGHCPPGYAKRQDGCRPRGHARNWQVGRQLPREVIFYDIPPQVTVLLGPPPSHHRYVRVASDILLITIGTGMVVDAIQDLNGM